MPDLRRLDLGSRLHDSMLVVEVDHRSYGDGKDCVVTAGALLHDIGKLEAYAWDAGFRVTEPGALLDLIASRHGKLEFGAAVPPMTLEAEVLHYADNASAKTRSMAEAVEDADNFQGDDLVSARAIWQLDRRKAYRGRSDWGLESSDPRK